MRGVPCCYYFPSSWDVFGSPEDEESNENNWDLLATNNYDESTYCRTLDSSRCNDPTNVGTYLLNDTKKGYKHLKWRLKNAFGNKNPFFPTSGIDVYGILSNSMDLGKRETIVCGKLCILKKNILRNASKTSENLLF